MSSYSSQLECRVVTLGMFIIDEFSFSDANGVLTGETRSPQIGGGGTYACIGARLCKVGMIIDTGADFPEDARDALNASGEDMWLFRERADGSGTTRALNIYRGEHRDFKYLTPRIRLTPRDLVGTALAAPGVLHFVCSPKRARVITMELRELGWAPIIVYEPIPDSCVPEEMPALLEVMPWIDVLSPNAEEALSLLGSSAAVTKETVQNAAARFVEMSVANDCTGSIVVRSGALGAYVASRRHTGRWIDAYWEDHSKVVDVTGAGNTFLGGLAAGLVLCANDLEEATLYASVSASFAIEQGGLPRLTRPAFDSPEMEQWNDDSPRRRLEQLRARHRR